MTTISKRDVRNGLLAALPPGDFELIQRSLERVHLPVGTTIGQLGAPIEIISFPEGGVCALLVPAAARERLALGMIGREGVVGGSALLGARHWQYEVLLRGAGATFLQIESRRLLDACQNSPRLRDLMLYFAGTLFLQISRAAVTNLVEPVEKRLARWILLYHDRLDGSEIAMTHEEMSIMLGVRRASATDALHMLEGIGAIRSVRGLIVVQSRERLEEKAGTAYGDAEAEYRRLIGPFGKSSSA